MTCWLCKRDVSDGLYVNVVTDTGIERCCDTCWERGEEAVVVPLDMTVDSDA